MRKKRRPIILLIGVDSLRAEHTSCYGYPRLTTSHLDWFAREETLFEMCLAAYRGARDARR